MEKYLTHFMEYIEGKIPVLTGFCLKVILSIVVFYIGRKVIIWLVGLLRKSLGRANVDTGVIQFTGSLAKFALYCLLIFTISTNFGVTEASVAALIAASGLTLGIGLQGGIANLAGGVMILLFRPFQVGDYIIVGTAQGIEGTILKIEMCYTTLATIDNKSIVVPNGTLSNSCVTNVTAKDNRKLEIKVGISYESSMKEAKKILERLLHEDKAIQSDQEMVVFVDELADSSVIIGFRAWVKTEEYWPTRWRMNERIKEEFDEHGIQIPYPQMDVHIR